MNKKGMTLVELLAVIVILAIISLLIAPNIVEMRNESLRQTLNSKLTRIKNAAITYAEDNLTSVPNKFSDSCLDYSSVDTCAVVKKSMKVKTCGGGRDLNCDDYCLIVYVNTLIEQGYLIGDNNNKTQIVHPATGEVLNYEKICVRYNTDIVSSNILDYSTSDTVQGDSTVTSKNKTQGLVEGRKLIAYFINEDDIFKY